LNFWLLSPELSLVGVALVVVIADLFIGRKKALAAISVIGLMIPLAFSIALWGEQDTSFAGMLAVDQFSLFFKFIILGITALVILASTDYVTSRIPRLQGEYYALILLAACGLMLMAAAKELISVYIAIELSSISLYSLVSFLRDEKSSEAGLKYLLLGAMSSAFLLLGMAFVYGLTGSTHLDVIADRVGRLINVGLWDNPALLSGVVLIVAGFGFKLASVPFHMWVPDVYEGAPTPITAYLSVASKAAGFAVILRVFYTAFGSTAFLTDDWGMIFAVIAAITMTVGNIAALAQKNIKRMLAYSSVSHAGYLMVGLAAISNLAESGVMFFLFAYALANLGVFIAIIAISNKTGSDEIADYAGMSRRSPLVALVMAFCLISLIGIPPTGGFIAKFYIFNAAVQQDLLWLVIIAAINSVISAFYYLRVVKVMYVGEAASDEPIPSSISLRIALAITSLGVLFLGIYPWAVLRLAETASAFFP